MRNVIRALIQDEQGQGLVEYGLILSLVAIACVGATRTLGTKINTSLTTSGSSLP